jgi:hypothetical protein
MKVPANEATLDTLSQDIDPGIVADYHRFVLEVPANFFLRKEPGTVMSFNVADEDFIDVALATSSMVITDIKDGIATVDMTVASGYLRILLNDLKKVKDVFIILDEDNTPKEIQ